MIDLIISESWFKFLTPWQQQLAKLSWQLLIREQQSSDYWCDYSFILFSMSKVYEGFLKKLLYEMELIDQQTYEGRRFRIGRALNPNVAVKHRDQYWLYDNLSELCGSELADNLWMAWTECRNQVFHFFPGGKKAMSLEEAKNRLEQLADVMSQAVSCLNASKYGAN